VVVLPRRAPEKAFLQAADNFGGGIAIALFSSWMMMMEEADPDG
jgi:hypothetical protein